MKILGRCIFSLLLGVAANMIGISGAISNTLGKILFYLVMILFVLIVNISPSLVNRRLKSRRLVTCANGCELLILFVTGISLTFVYYLGALFKWWPIGFVPTSVGSWIGNTVVATLVLAGTFWSGMIRVYLTSVQLGMRYRVLGAVLGWIPIVHLIMLGIIIRTVSKEITYENDKILLNEKRKQQAICSTKYPILMVHGVFFRDFRYLNYWGRIPEQLIQNGAKIFYGNHSSALAVEDSAKELAERIKQIVRETGCEKVNVIAHSKGGLDTRCALQSPEIAQHVASLTTINTPHRGCEFADYLLTKIGEKEQRAVAAAYNSTLKKLGDPAPDFLAAVYDLTASRCAALNQRVKDVEGILYQSVGSKMNVPQGGRFPLNLSYHLVNYFDGANDGLVGEKSFPWGEHFQFLTVHGKRGISHGDMIDLNRENFDEFDVREFYVQLVANLKRKGF